MLVIKVDTRNGHLIQRVCARYKPALHRSVLHLATPVKKSGCATDVVFIHFIACECEIHNHANH